MHPCECDDCDCLNTAREGEDLCYDCEQGNHEGSAW